MRTVRRILVAIKDPSARSLPAVDKAVQLAKVYGAQLELFHDIADHVYVDFELGNEKLDELKRSRLAECRNRLEAIAERARKQDVTVHTSVVWDYPPHEAIVRHAQSTRADLIVAECHAGRRLAPAGCTSPIGNCSGTARCRSCSSGQNDPIETRYCSRRSTRLTRMRKPTQLDDEILKAACR
ncbi:MAG: universal stress protein [Gammaproteobacteria bacterium]